LYVPLAATLLSIPALNAKQQPNDVRAAPLPAQIATAKRVFISYAGGIPEMPPQGDVAYNQFYAAIKGWGRYELLAAPADADLVLEITVMYGVGRECYSHPLLRLVILDPKTHIVVWAFTEGVHGDLRHYDFDGAITKIVDDIKSLDARAKVAAGSA